MWWNDKKKVGNQRKQLEMVGDITYVTYIYIIIHIHIYNFCIHFLGWYLEAFKVLLVQK